MSTTRARDKPADDPGRGGLEGPDGVVGSRAPWWGLGAAVVVLVLSTVVPPLVGWNVMARSDDLGPWAPTHGFWDPKLGPGTVPAVAIAVLAVAFAHDWAARWSWGTLLLASYVVGLAWLLALALVDGEPGITRVLGNPYEYLPTARDVTDVGSTLSTFVDHIPADATDNWPTHVAGHPAGALLFFVALVRVGLGGDLAAGLVVTAIAATTAVAVMVTLRALGAEDVARRAAPFLVLTPAAVYMAVSADAMFAAVGAWGLAALALAAVSTSRSRMVTWAALAGLLLGYCVFLSYGLPLLGVLALAVLLCARSWRPLPVAVGAALVVTAAFALAGFAWWEAYPVLHERYYAGIASDRPFSYWVWGNLGALLYAAGPLVGAGFAAAVTLRPSPRTLGDLPTGTRVAIVLTTAGALMIALADLSGMSKAEVERIWLPFVPWLTVGLALLPAAWRRWGLGPQVGFALVVQHLLYTSW